MYWQSGRHIHSGVVHDAGLQLAVVNRCGKTVQVGYEKVYVILFAAAFSHVDYRQQCAEIIADV